MKKPYKTESTILGLPVVISEVWPPSKVECLDSESQFNVTGGLELQCSKATFDEMEADPAKKAIVADTVRSIQIALRRKRRASN
jgi:hypothetical protein